MCVCMMCMLIVTGFYSSFFFMLSLYKIMLLKTTHVRGHGNSIGFKCPAVSRPDISPFKFRIVVMRFSGHLCDELPCVFESMCNCLP
mmetsp:Transcript_143471/g.248356  ORF Transcript_143471/g.248356 Transcript_143471/m.248356 type:complete len:87 (-) Transcript_143471:13-273(-)